VGRDLVPSPMGELAAFEEHMSSVRLSAAAVYARGAPTSSFAWDFTGDGKTDLVTATPFTRHIYGPLRPNQQVKVQVAISHADGIVTHKSLCLGNEQGKFAATPC
jgi:hypothetical protein